MTPQDGNESTKQINERPRGRFGGVDESPRELPSRGVPITTIALLLLMTGLGYGIMNSANDSDGGTKVFLGGALMAAGILGLTVALLGELISWLRNH